MSSQPSDFSLSALNVYINTEISGLFFQEAIPPQLQDTSYQINVRVSTTSVNQLFLFHTSNTLGDTIESDLTDLSSSDFKYAFNVSQWNPSIQTTRQERKLVIENYLIDLFGGNRIDALRNIDVFSNEDELDRDISDIFHNRANALQRQALEPSSNNVHGSFLHNGSLVTALASVIDNAASTNPDAVSQKLLEIASILSRDNNNNVLVRQFADTNTSNFDYNLPSGWRTFQFIENDVISFNLTIGQPSSFYPPWSENQSALSNGGTNTSFRINLIVTDSPSGQVADFFTPTITSQQLDTVVQSVQVPNVVANVLGISSENFNVISISNEIIDQSNVLLKTTVTLDLCFNTLTENNIQSIINDIRDSYATQLNVNPLSINVTLQSGSVIVIIEQVRDLPSRIDLSGLSVITLNQTASYIEPGVIAYVHGRTHVDGVPYTVDIDLGGLSPNNLVPGSYTITYSISGQSHISATRQVVVIDDIPPTLQLIGDASVSINQGDTYYELGARIIDNGVDIGAATPSVTVDVYTAGSYTITYNGVDAAGNAATPITRTVVVIDNIAPTLQLTGDASVSINQGETYTEQGARIIDNGVDIGAATPSGTVDVDTVGSYTITYNGVDAAGNAATPITRTVVVIDNIAPTLQLTGDASVSINQGETYTEQGARIIDNGVDIGAATPSGTVDVDTVGSYTITYNGVDAAGNAATPITRTVTVISSGLLKFLPGPYTSPTNVDVGTNLPSGTSAFTVSFEVKLGLNNDYPTNFWFYGQPSGGRATICSIIEGGELNCGHYQDDVSIPKATIDTYFDNNYHTIVFTRKEPGALAPNSEVYIDGTLIGSRNLNGSPGMTPTSIFQIANGIGWDGYTFESGMEIRNIMIYDTYVPP